MLRDIKHAWVQFRRSPAVAAAIVVAMTTGITVTTAAFAFVNGVLLHPFPYRDSDRLAVLWSSDRDEPRFAVSPADFLDWKRASRTFADMAAIQLFRDRSVALSGIGDPEEVESVRATWNIFDLLGVRPILGRSFRQEDAEPGQSPVILIADGLWRRRFGGLPSVLGQRVNVDGKPAEIIGVLPPHFQLPRTDIESNAEIFLTIASTAGDEQIRGRSCCGVVGRLQASASLDRAQAELRTIADRLAAEYPATNKGQTVAVDPLYTTVVGDIRPTLLTLFAAASMLLLIGSASVSNLLLARFSARRIQIATQASLGATPGRIARQMLTEAGVLAVVAGVLSAFGTLYTLRSLLALIPRTTYFTIPRSGDIGVDRAVFLFAFVVTMASAFLIGWPAARAAARVDLNALLKEQSRGAGADRKHRRVRTALMAAQIALALVLVTATTLAFKSYRNIEAVDPGFRADEVLTVRMTLPFARYADGAAFAAFYRQLVSRLASTAAVQRVSMVNMPPLGGLSAGHAIHVEGTADLPRNEWPVAGHAVVGPDYFGMLRIPLLSGREFTTRDAPTGTPVAIVSESFVRRFLPGVEPIGRLVTIADEGRNPRQIVGVVGDVRARALVRSPVPMVYVPFEQLPQRTATILTQTTGEPMSAAAAVRRETITIDPAQPIGRVRTLSRLVDEARARYTVTALVLALFGGAAIVISVCGVYGMTMHTSSERRHEVGVRMALGAQPMQVLVVLAREMVMTTITGTIVGVALSWSLATYLQTILFGVQPRDPTVFALIPIGCAVVATGCAVLACVGLLRLRPVDALR